MVERIIHMYQTPSCRAGIYINRPLYQVTRLASPHAVCAPYKNIYYRRNRSSELWIVLVLVLESVAKNDIPSGWWVMYSTAWATVAKS